MAEPHTTDCVDCQMRYIGPLVAQEVKEDLETGIQLESTLFGHPVVNESWTDGLAKRHRE